MYLETVEVMYTDFFVLLWKNLPDNHKKCDLPIFVSNFSLVNDYKFSEADIKELVTAIKDYHNKVDLSRLDVLINTLISENCLDKLTVGNLFENIIDVYMDDMDK